MTHQHGCAGSVGTGAEVVVEHVAAQRDRMVRELAVAWPGRGDLAIAVDETHPGEPVTTQVDRVDPQRRQLADGSR
jgi:hypothetical protein